MKTQEEKFAVFHTGRGGRFHNAGYVSFEGIYTEQEFINILDSRNWIFDKNRDKKGCFCKPYWADCNGNFIAYMGDRVFDFDGDYNKYEMKSLNELEPEDFYIIFRDKKYIDDEILHLVTMQQLAVLVDSFNEWKISFNEVIKANGWIDETGEEYGICSNGKQRLQFNANGVTEIQKL